MDLEQNSAEYRTKKSAFYHILFILYIKVKVWYLWTLMPELKGIEARELLRLSFLNPLWPGHL